MQMNLSKFTLCPECGSTERLENYPSSGVSVCGKCGHRAITISLTEMREDKVYDQVCSFCGAEGEDDDTLFENESVVVFKCKKCGTIDGYFITEEPLDRDRPGDEPYDLNFSREAIEIAQSEGTANVFSASKYQEISRALKKKEKDPKEQNKRQLWQLEKEKTPLLRKVEIMEDTIKMAASEVQSYLSAKEAVTLKQLTILFAASILVSEELQLRRKDLPLGHATERNLSEIFNVDRKTIRKWKTLMLQQRPKVTWGVNVYNSAGLIETARIEIPEDIIEVIKLGQPSADKCCFFVGKHPLCWRIKYRNGNYSDISSEAYEAFKKTYWENNGTLALP